MPRPKMGVIGKALRPREDEVARNARARSAILRIAERTEEA
jgi:16S rRNA (cytosine1402-N4)-methyltransferase